MGRFIFWLVGLLMTVGLAPKLIALTLKVAGMATQAQSHDQISYAKFNRSLWTHHKRAEKAQIKQ